MTLLPNVRIPQIFPKCVLINFIKIQVDNNKFFYFRSYKKNKIGTNLQSQLQNCLKKITLKLFIVEQKVFIVCIITVCYKKATNPKSSVLLGTTQVYT